MANQTLFITSCLMVVIHLLAVGWYGGPIPLQVLYVLGPFTSFLNHGTTSPWTLWLDRSVMAVGCPLDLGYASQLPERGLLWAATGCTLVCYCLRKMVPSSVLHVAAHAFVTASHFGMLYFYSKEFMR
jgi:hypothetical protein